MGLFVMLVFCMVWKQIVNILGLSMVAPVYFVKWRSVLILMLVFVLLMDLVPDLYRHSSQCSYWDLVLVLPALILADMDINIKTGITTESYFPSPIPVFTQLWFPIDSVIALYLQISIFFCISNSNHFSIQPRSWVVSHSTLPRSDFKVRPKEHTMVHLM